MGDLQRKLFLSKLKQAESTLGLDFSESGDPNVEQEEVRGPITTQSSMNAGDGYPKWDKYFKQNKIVVQDGQNSFNTYYTPPKSEISPVFIFHHGAGSSGMTFGLLAKEIISQMSDPRDKESSQAVAGIFAFDARGHGATEVRVGSEDYSLDRFAEDARFLIEDLIKREGLSNNPLFLVGHSLGGSILTKVVNELRDPQIKGLCMFDIVEETAIRALNGMDMYLSHLPKNFNTLSSAIDWHIRTNLLRNMDSAVASVPSYFKYDENSKTYKWIIDLKRTKPNWDTWFLNLSKSFVNAPCSKLLILAGTDSLDKELMIGQMQGKYQLVVFQDSGHFIQEDVPRKTAITLIDFWKRNDKNQVVIKSTWGPKK